VRLRAAKALVATLAVVFGACAAASCGDDGTSGPCGDGERSLAFLEPLDGAMLGPADDIDPAMAGLQTQIRLRACGFEPDEQIGVYLLDPVETAYAFVSADDGTPITVVPLVPGMLRMQARTMDSSVESEIITLDVTLD
jgi:hypothetical protein